MLDADRWNANVMEYQDCSGIVPEWAKKGKGPWDAGHIVMSNHQREAAAQRWQEQQDFAEQWLSGLDWSTGMRTNQPGNNSVSAKRVVTCDECKGTGWVWWEHEGGHGTTLCPYCSGEGHRHKIVEEGTPVPERLDVSQAKNQEVTMKQRDEWAIATLATIVLLSLVLAIFGR